jgi:hypothetical protein
MNFNVTKTVLKLGEGAIATSASSCNPNIEGICNWHKPTKPRRKGKF